MTIEKIVYNYLKAKNLPAFVGEPSEKPTTRHIIYKTNHNKNNHLSTATIVIWSYGSSLVNASDNDKNLRDAMEEIIALNSVSSCTLENSFNDTRTGSKEFRYRSEFNLVFYE